MRNMLFVSHANPQDNAFAKWLSLQLAAHGYGVWSDVTQLLGGERFWDDIEEALRHRAMKFLYVLSRSSNEKQGPRAELAVARAVEAQQKFKDFIIPLAIDDLSPAQYNVEIHRLNAIGFKSWSQGLSQLLLKLETEGIEKNPAFSPNAVALWWKDQVRNAASLKNEPELLQTNWYPLGPTRLYFHELRRVKGPGEIRVPEVLPFPGVQYKQYLIAFAPSSDFTAAIEGQLEFGESLERTINPADTAPDLARLWSYADERRAISQLLRQAWDSLLRARKVPVFTFANKASAFYFLKGQVPEDRVWFRRPNDTRSYRDVIGFKTIGRGEGIPSALRYWHYALEAKPSTHPVVGFTMKSHVLFSDDGQHLWSDKNRLHSARRSQCKAWWNDKWRDLVTAGVSWLAGGTDWIELATGSSSSIRVSSIPILLSSPVSYDEDQLSASEPGILDSDEADTVEVEDEADSPIVAEPIAEADIANRGLGSS